MLSFGNIFDYTDDMIDINDDNNNLQNDEKLLKQNLLNYINTDFNTNNSMEKDNLSSIRSDSYIDETYFKNNEQICEVKVNLYYMLSLNFVLIRDSTTNYFMFLNDKNLVKARRLIIQNFSINNKNIIYHNKEYIFISRANECIFKYNNNTITYKKMKNNKGNTMALNDELLLNKEQFIEKFAKTEVKQLFENEFIKKNKNKSKEKKEEEKSENSGLSFMTSTDDSENEGQSGEQFYKINNENNFTRFIYNDYQKEIDGIYTQHKSIDLITDKRIELFDGIENLNEEEAELNDLNCKIIYKNFIGSIIDENEPILLEIKQGFRLIDLLNQIKQNAKICDRFQCDKEIKMPKVAIGIICTDFNSNYQEQIDMLKKDYDFDQDTQGNKISYLKHITNIFEKNNFKVIIGIFKNSKIVDYPLYIEDYNIEDKNLSKRVDLYYLNTATKLNKSKEEIDKLEKELKKKFKSLSYIKTVPIDKHRDELNLKDQLLLERNQELNEINNLVKNIYQKLGDGKENVEIKKMIEEFEKSKTNKKDK